MATEEILGVVLLMTSHWACVLREESFCTPNAFLSSGVLQRHRSTRRVHSIGYCGSRFPNDRHL